METLMAFLVGLLFTAGTYMILSRTIVRIILGTALLSHGAHLLLITMGGLKGGAAPLLDQGNEVFVDSLPQALILTAIVINFGVTAFFLVLAYRGYKELGTDNLYYLRGNKDE